MRSPCAYRYALKRPLRPLAFSRDASRRFLHDSSGGYSAAVIGGGITGLVAAHRLAKDPECSRVTLYEKSSRLGGWIQSEKIRVDGGDIVFEHGPRTLRLAPPASYALLDLVADLKLEDQMLLTPKSSPATQNRYIYYPDHLVRIPTPQKGVDPINQITTVLSTVLQEPLFKTVLWSLITEAWKPNLRNPPRDESVYAYLSRRFSPELADNLVSSVYHGIFAGDIDQLSAQTLLGQLRRTEFQGGSIMSTIFESMTSGTRRYILEDLLAMEAIAGARSTESQKNYIKLLGRDSSTLTFKKGVRQLVDALIEALNRSGKVRILTNVDISRIVQDPKSHDLTIHCEDGKSHIHNRLIATISPKVLSEKLQDQASSENPWPSRLSLACQKHNYATTTMVVNLYYPNPNLLPVKGFGYLIPRSIPFIQNPEQALGVIFASESSIGQDTAPGTKLTVMLGGYYWDGWDESNYPSPAKAIEMAQSLLERHLGITDPPTVTRARLQRNAIPQPIVGHQDNLNDISNEIREKFNNRITLAGAWYSYRGTGVVDCIRQAYLAANYYVKGKRPEKLPNLYQALDFEGGITGSPPRVLTSTPEVLTRNYF
ncbi:hypothetical protein BDV18DRAFT_128169 [Aspergillus unguis]